MTESLNCGRSGPSAEVWRPEEPTRISIQMHRCFREVLRRPRPLLTW
jgi:hypothetical protein